MFNPVQKILSFSIKNVQKILLKAAKDAFFPNLENVFIAMLSDKNENAFRLVINEAHSLRGIMPIASFITHSEESASDTNPDMQLSIRQSVLP